MNLSAPGAAFAGHLPRLLVMDIDGTLADSEGKISERNHRAVERFAQAGGAVYLASGRKYEAVQEAADELGPFTNVIASNGCVVETCGELTVERIPLSALEAVYTATRGAGVSLFLLGLSRTYYADSLPSYFVAEDRARLVSGKESMLHKIADAEDVRRFADDVVNGIIIDEAESGALDHLRAQLASVSGLSLSSSFPNNIELIPHGVSKETAIRRIQAELGVTPAETMAIGDGMNDLGMFACAELSVAMGNAPDRVRTSARYITASNDEDGVAVSIDWALGAP